MLGSEDEERVGAVKVLVVLDGAKPIGVAVSEKVLRSDVPTVCEAFDQAGSLTDKVVVLLDGLFDLNDVGLGGTDASIMKTANSNWISRSGFFLVLAQ